MGKEEVATRQLTPRVGARLAAVGRSTESGGLTFSVWAVVVTTGLGYPIQARPRESLQGAIRRDK